MGDVKFQNDLDFKNEIYFELKNKNNHDNFNSRINISTQKYTQLGDKCLLKSNLVPFNSPWSISNLERDTKSICAKLSNIFIPIILIIYDFKLVSLRESK